MLRVILWAALLAGVGAGIGLGVAKFTTPIYEARATLVASGASDLAAARGEALTTLRSPSLFQLAVDKAAQAHPELRSKRSTELLPSHTAVEGAAGSALEVRVQSPNPQIAADVDTAIITEYNEKATTFNSAEAADRRVQLAGQTSAAKSRADALQKSIAALKEKTGVLNMDTAIQTAATYQATLAQQGDADQNRLQALKERLSAEQTKFEATSPTTSGPVVEGTNPRLAADIANLQALQAKRIDLLGTWLPTSQTVAAVDVKIKAQEQLIASENLQALQVQRRETQPNPARLDLERAIAQDSAQIAGLTASISEVGKAQNRQNQAVKGLPANEAKMLDLQRELDLATSKYKSLQASSDALAVNGAATQLPILNTFLGAEAPRTPIWPDFNLMISVGAAIGLVLGVMVGISTMPRHEEYEVGPQLPIGPAGPELPSGISAPPLPARRGDSLTALALPSASPAEAYRFMVFSMLSSGEETTRTVLFTGVSSDSLCCEAAAQFAIAMSQSGVRTLLADCNLRHHGLTDAFGFRGKSGISDVLSRTMLPTPGTDLVLATEHPDLFFMPSGSLEDEGLGGFANLQISGLVQDLKERADVKVLNTPACAVVADAPRLVRFADNVCLVASKADRSRGLVAKAHEILKRAGATDVDVLVIDRDESKDSFLG
ncbi:MAG: GumC family protein [Fimbriimonadaceae bacterium]